MSEFLYSVEREVAHPIADLWHAWTDAAALEAWYFPTALSSVLGLTVSDARPGGAWRVARGRSRARAGWYGELSRLARRLLGSLRCVGPCADDQCEFAENAAAGTCAPYADAKGTTLYGYRRSATHTQGGGNSADSHLC